MASPQDEGETGGASPEPKCYWCAAVPSWPRPFKLRGSYGDCCFLQTDKLVSTLYNYIGLLKDKVFCYRLFDRLKSGCHVGSATRERRRRRTYWKWGCSFFWLRRNWPTCAVWPTWMAGKSSTVSNRPSLWATSPTWWWCGFTSHTPHFHGARTVPNC